MAAILARFVRTCSSLSLSHSYSVVETNTTEPHWRKTISDIFMKFMARNEIRSSTVRTLPYINTFDT